MGERILKVQLSTRAQPLCVLPTSEQIVNTNTNSFTSVSVSGTLKTPPLLILALCSHLLASRGQLLPLASFNVTYKFYSISYESKRNSNFPVFIFLLKYKILFMLGANHLDLVSIMSWWSVSSSSYSGFSAR